MSDIHQILRPDVIPKFISVSSGWIRFFNNSPTSLLNSTIHIALGYNQGALQIINILLDTSLNPNNVTYKNAKDAQIVSSACQDILELILQEIEYVSR